MVVLDASALIAAIKGEPGGDDVWRICREASGGLAIHAINASEVAYHFIRFGIPPVEALKLADVRGIAVAEIIERRMWERSAILKAEYKNLALGDCMAIAFAEQLDADLVTGDRQFKNVETSAHLVIFR